MTFAKFNCDCINEHLTDVPCTLRQAMLGASDGQPATAFINSAVLSDDGKLDIWFDYNEEVYHHSGIAKVMDNEARFVDLIICMDVATIPLRDIINLDTIQGNVKIDKFICEDILSYFSKIRETPVKLECSESPDIFADTKSDNISDDEMDCDEMWEECLPHPASPMILSDHPDDVKIEENAQPQTSDNDLRPRPDFNSSHQTASGEIASVVLCIRQALKYSERDESLFYEYMSAGIEQITGATIPPKPLETTLTRAPRKKNVFSLTNLKRWRSEQYNVVEVIEKLRVANLISKLYIDREVFDKGLVATDWPPGPNFIKKISVNKNSTN